MIILSAPFLARPWVALVFLAVVVLCVMPSTIRAAAQARSWREAVDECRTLLLLLGAFAVLALVHALTR